MIDRAYICNMRPMEYMVTKTLSHKSISTPCAVPATLYSHAGIPASSNSSRHAPVTSPLSRDIDVQQRYRSLSS